MSIYRFDPTNLGTIFENRTMQALTAANKAQRKSIFRNLKGLMKGIVPHEEIISIGLVANHTGSYEILIITAFGNEEASS